MKKSTGTIDKEIGSRMRMRRMLVGMSQEKLGEMLGLTFQQVQKYEKGTNRISVSRMIDIAHVLGVDIHFFFEGLTGGGKKAGGFAEPAQPAFVSDFMATQEGHQLMRAFTRISNPKTRRAVVQLAASLADEEDAPRKRSK
ncbi:MAG TPA: helix-turn-helix transcriptional regulator [Microvirga sp.]|jgi:transcriptional regulator with XRE-family HTH domain|nr:helix-turn-helix transcriptional regulator [Microvirga sp.]